MSYRRIQIQFPKGGTVRRGHSFFAVCVSSFRAIAKVEKEWNEKVNLRKRERRRKEFSASGHNSVLPISLLGGNVEPIKTAYCRQKSPTTLLCSLLPTSNNFIFEPYLYNHAIFTLKSTWVSAQQPPRVKLGLTMLCHGANPLINFVPWELFKTAENEFAKKNIL